MHAKSGENSFLEQKHVSDLEHLNLSNNLLREMCHLYVWHLFNVSAGDSSRSSTTFTFGAVRVSTTGDPQRSILEAAKTLRQLIRLVLDWLSGMLRMRPMCDLFIAVPRIKFC